MKNLKLAYNGGHPLRIDDANHLQSGIKSILEELANSIMSGHSPAILYGAKIYEDGGDTYVQKGVLFIDGELFQIAADSIPGTGLLDLEYQVLEDFQSPSPVEYKDLTTRNVHRDRYAVLGRSSARPGNYVQGYSIDSFKRPSDNWVEPNLNSNWIQKDPNGQGLNPQYNMDYFQKKVELRGVLHYASGAVPGAVIFTLPVGHRPAQKVIRQIFISANMAGVGFDVNTNCPIVIDTNGEVSVNISVGFGIGYHLDGTYFYV